MNQQDPWLPITIADLSEKIIGSDIQVVFPTGHQIVGTLVGIHHQLRPREANSSDATLTRLDVDVYGVSVGVDFAEVSTVRLLNSPSVL